ncbi:hypothetical protein L2E82_20530 [Cichorium intybus]|uniref:Uncharacterized protein n=1 Tax=Cichorium intybus TaxID=13427 RepID=A0ACB9DTK4_CICIN|nr:hypothetical protein L2E82_20530 [Cichorium intybus]
MLTMPGSIAAVFIESGSCRQRGCVLDGSSLFFFNIWICFWVGERNKQEKEEPDAKRSKPDGDGSTSWHTKPNARFK